MTEKIPDQGATRVIGKIRDLHDRCFAVLENTLGDWFIPLGARILFAMTLMIYYLNSAATKLGEGVFGVFAPSAGAFAQILPSVAEHYVYDTSAIPFFPWHLIVIAGTIGEIVLPILIVIGLFTRLAAIGMIVFVMVQTVVDVAFHAAKLGAWFDVQASDLIDQRALWVFLFLLLVVKGAGAVSVDAWWRQSSKR